VEATLECDEWTDAVPYVFTSNGNYTFLYHDLAGNEASTIATVGRIDITPPWAVSVAYTPPMATNQDVMVTLLTNEPVYTPTGWTPIDDTTFTRRFTGNLSTEVSFLDLVGNSASTGITITRIDKTAVTGAIAYTTTGATSGAVIATISFAKTGVVITNNDGNRDYLFTGNGAFTFSFVDPAGNS
jgi:hypothetical protein